MRAKSTTQQSKEQETYLEQLFSFVNARRSRSSGAQSNDRIDVVSDVFAMECESTEKKSYSLKLSFWEEVVEKSGFSRRPHLAIRFRNASDRRAHVDLVVIEANDYAEHLEELQELRREVNDLRELRAV